MILYTIFGVLSENIRFNPVKCGLISSMLMLFFNLVYIMVLLEERKDMNDKNTLGAEIENFQLICTLRKAFVFSLKRHLDSS